jgi:Tfp pilus assembly protein PilF
VSPTAGQRKAELLKELDSKFVNPRAHVELAKIYQDEKQLDEAEYHYSTALSFDPVSWPAQAGIVKIKQLKGSRHEAAVAAEVYINQVAASGERSLKLAIAFDLQKLDEYALTCYQQALRLDPESARVYKHIGYFYLDRGDEAQAEKNFVKSFNLDRLQPDVAKELGRLRVTIELPQKAPRDSKASDPKSNL